MLEAAEEYPVNLGFLGKGNSSLPEPLEEQIMAQDRLAAIGRVAAGVAHEINNPLGGLLTAIDTYRHRPVDLKHPDRTLDLIERGLNQIHAIVSALLVESRLESRALNPHDIEDVETLIRTDSAAQLCAVPPARWWWSHVFPVL